MDTVSRNATLTDRRDVTERLSIVRVRPDSPLTEFTPGQYIALGLDVSDQDIPPTERGLLIDGPVKLLHRYYSIVSPGSSLDELEFFVTRVEDGDLTARLWECAPGSRMWVDDRAQGTFTLGDVPEGRNLVMVATGTGVGPYISMLRTYQGTDRWKRLVLVHGVRHLVDLGFASEIREMQGNDPSILYVPTATRDDEGSGLRGRVQSVLKPDAFSRHAGFSLDPRHSNVFLCGNPEMIRSVRDLLEKRGFDSGEGSEPATIHFERYW